MNRLDIIYGPESSGDTAQERARTSKRVFVRSQVQLAPDSDAATGRRLTAAEALEAFGPARLERAVEEGSATIIADPREPAWTFGKRRKYLNLPYGALATAAGVTISDVKRSEVPGEILPIQVGEAIAQALALDERSLGAVPMARADFDFATRLRELNPAEARNHEFVTTLAEAAWVIRRQHEVTRLVASPESVIETEADTDYEFPTYEHGYELAERTRRLIGAPAEAPIESMHALLEDVLRVPVIRVDLAAGYAGATIINAGVRGIAVTASGANASTIVRRMTLAHELGHLLWDSNGRLQAVRVETDSRRGEQDPVEMRANAFAIAMLVPRAAVLRLYEEETTAEAAVARIVDEYGVFPTAAARHLANVCGLDYRQIAVPRKVRKSVEFAWEARDRFDDWADDLVRLSRGGRFARLTVSAVTRGLITPDTARSWLRVDATDLDRLVQRAAVLLA